MDKGKINDKVIIKHTRPSRFLWFRFDISKVFTPKPSKNKEVK